MLKEFIKKDYARYFDREYTFFNGVKAYFDTLTETRTLSYIMTLRICSYLDEQGLKLLLQPFRIRLRRLQLKFGLEISYKSKIGQGFRISHGFGIVIHPNAVIGENCTIMQNCTIGNNIFRSRDQVAVIGDNVSFGAGAKIVGPIIIGNNVAIGANAVVTHDIPDNSIVAGIPARIIRKFEP